MSKLSTLLMHRYSLTLVLSVAMLALKTVSASPSALHYGPAHVDYYKQVADSYSDVDTESDSDGSYDVFYDRLSPDGRWFYDDDYGYVWQPNVAASTPDWRPYADGHWVWTDRGWYWNSDEDFGWATYHYGRWVLIEDAGWIWIPGSRWAPAWVSWRHSENDDYVGWAPLPPESRFDPRIGFHGWSDSYYDIGPAAYAFIRIADFARPSYREFCLPPQQNVDIIQRTTNITNITYQNNVINNFGPQHEQIAQLVQQRSGQTIPSYKLNYAAQTQRDAAFKTAVQGNQLHVVGPPPTLKAVATAAPQVSRQLGKAQVNRGWQNVPQTQAQQLRQQFAQQAPAPKNLPAKPTLPVKPQIQAAGKPGTQPLNATVPGNNNPATRTEVKTPVQTQAVKPTFKTEGVKPTVQTPAGTPPEPHKSPETALEKKPEVAKPENRTLTGPGSPEKPPVNEVKKVPSEPIKHEIEAEPAHAAEKPAGHTTSPKPKVEQTKKPSPPPSSESHHPSETHAVVHHENPAPAEHHVAAVHVSKPPGPPPPPKPAGPPPSHHAPPANQKKKPEHKD
jgi:hypothetical protein